MQMSEITRRVNDLLDGEILAPRQMRDLLDNAIDKINETLNTIYPTFSELPEGSLEYVCFPDRYIRTVVCLGAAVAFYMRDEEGGNPPQGYAMEFQAGLFRMLRDYIHMVPDIYKAPDTLGTVKHKMPAVTDEDDVNPHVFRF